ncbi:MAG: FkbM family methyltransferase [Flavobacteriales bacterium]|nr:FkbM family methyltransferase [Flavobacteriales bacterium]
MVGGPAKGLRMLVNDRAPAFRQMIAGTYDAHIHEALDHAAIRPDMVLDVGAHMGYHVLCFAMRWPEARVVAFEPNPVNVGRLREQLVLNPSIAGRVEVMSMALADVDGRMDMRASSNIEDQTSSGGYLHGVRPSLPEEVYTKAGFHSFSVPVHRLDTLVEKHAWQGIGLVKIDVEGAEHMVLHGAMETLAHARPVLLIEVHSVACTFRVMELLHGLRYRVVLLHEEDPRRGFLMATSDR